MRKSTATALAALAAIPVSLVVAMPAQADDYKVCNQLSNGLFCTTYTVTKNGGIDKVVDTYKKTGGSGVSIRLGYQYADCDTDPQYTTVLGSTFTQSPGTTSTKTFSSVVAAPSGKYPVCLRGVLVDTISGSRFYTAVGHFGIG